MISSPSLPLSHSILSPDSSPRGAMPSFLATALPGFLLATAGGWDRTPLRCDRARWNGKRAMRHGLSRPSSTAAPTLCSRSPRDLPSDSNLEILKKAREKFVQEVESNKMDQEVSLAKTLLYVAAEDDSFRAFHREMDANAFLNERADVPAAFKTQLESVNLEEVSLSGKTISGWLDELDLIAEEVKAKLTSRDIEHNLVEVLEAVSSVLFESRGFRRSALRDPTQSYLHVVLSSGESCAILIGVIYIEICQRLGVHIVSSHVRKDLLVWPQTENLEELFRDLPGGSLFARINGRQDEKMDPQNSKSLSKLDIATNRDIIGFILANMSRLYWKRALRTNIGLMWTSPLQPVLVNETNKKGDCFKVPLLRPQELRLAIMASERLLILQPHNWSVMRDLGMLLYFNQRYVEAIRELSICMAGAPAEDVALIEPFIQKLHLLRVLSKPSCNMMEQAGPLTVS